MYLEGTPRRSRGLVIGVVLASVALLCGLGGVAGFLLARDSDGGSGATPRGESPVPAEQTPSANAEPTPPANAQPPGGRGHTVVYEVSGGSGSAIITYNAGGAPTPDQVDLPWRTEVTVAGRVNLLMVFAVHFSSDPLTCRILVDGQEVTTATSDNAVTCTHLVGD
jgi:hypothetical protein